MSRVTIAITSYANNVYCVKLWFEVTNMWMIGCVFDNQKVVQSMCYVYRTE